MTLPAEERGGLGILLTGKVVDGASRGYRDGMNVLTLVKKTDPKGKQVST